MPARTTRREGAPPRSRRTIDDFEKTPVVGDVVAGKYTIESVLGIGGMALVLSARVSPGGEHVALKVIDVEVAKNKTAVARFFREAQAAAALSSTHVVRVLDSGETALGLPFLVMEQLDGRDLGSILDQRKRLPTAEAVDYVIQACAGVAEAHAAGIVHRDLKPSNLFVVRPAGASPLLKVLDFGVSKVIDGEGGAATLTDTLAFLGSPAYMSPEQVRSAKHVDSRTDIWALGVILYELLSGELPFEGASAAAMCAAIVSQEPTPLRAFVDDAPRALEAAIARCLARDREARFQSVAELARALAPFGTERSRAVVEKLQTVLPIAPRRTRSRSTRVRTLVIALIAALVGAAVTFFVARRRDEPALPDRTPSFAIGAAAPTTAASQAPSIAPPTLDVIDASVELFSSDAASALPRASAGPSTGPSARATLPSAPSPSASSPSMSDLLRERKH